MRVLWIMAVMLMLGSVWVQAAPSYLGPSGNIMTPDDLTVPQGNFSLGYHQFLDLAGSDEDLSVFHGHYGLTPNIEIGLSLADPDDGDDEVAINAKWRFVDETARGPAIVVGVIDVAGEAFDDDPSFYVLISKNLTPVASDIVDERSRPLRGTLGVGTGFYDGIFLGLDWTLTPRLSLMAEYVQGGDILGDDNMVNAGIRYAVGPGFRLDAAAIDFDEFAFGVSYTSGF